MKSIFKRGLLKNGKSKNVLEIDVEKDGGIFFFLNVCLINMILLTLNLLYILTSSKKIVCHLMICILKIINH